MSGTRKAECKDWSGKEIFPLTISLIFNAEEPNNETYGLAANLQARQNV